MAMYRRFRAVRRAEFTVISRPFRRSLTLLLGLTFLPAVAQAQTATITGQVTDAGTNQPLAEAQIFVAGTPRGSRTGADGRFRIAGVPEGMVQVRAIRLGYGAQSRTLNLAAAQAVTVDFALAASATTLDEIVVTATGASELRRESGVTVGRIETSKVPLAATPTLSNVLNARSPGLSVTQSGGTTGTSSRIRIRGSNSINLTNEPLLIVDGVRVNNSSTSFSVGLGGQTISRFDDINPEEIESVEVVKGPAAASLYGTAAANGVIVVRTKRGGSGPPRWNAYAETGSVKDYIDYPANFRQIGRSPTGARVTSCTIDAQARGACTPYADSLLSFNPIEAVSPFRNGFRNSVGANVGGGTDVATYFFSAEQDNEQGVYEASRLKRINLRANVNARLASRADLQASVGYFSSRSQFPFNDNTAFGAISAGLLGKAFDCSRETFKQQTLCGVDSLSRGYFTANVGPADYFVIQSKQANERFTGGLNANWQLLSWLQAIGQAGMDIVQRHDHQLTPANRVAFSPTTLEGSRFSNRVYLPTYNTSGSLVATYRVTSSLQSTTSAGGQYTREDFRSTSGFGAKILPGTGSLDGTSARFAVDEDNQQVVTLGLYAQQKFGWRDRLFLNAALRGDQGSTFGAEFGKIYYPSISISHVLSEETWFPRFGALDQFRWRIATGRSGQRPSFRQAETFFSPVSVNVSNIESPAITLGGTGNAILKPEKTDELEGGFDLTAFGSRLALEFTAYRKVTDDALINRRLAPSLGATLTRVENLGQVRNSGVEGLLTLVPLSLRREALRWESSISASHNKNKLVRLGEGITPVIFGFSSVQQFRGGFPAGGFFQRTFTYSDINGDGLIGRVNCPTVAGVANPQVPGGPACEITLSDSVEYLGTPIAPTQIAFNNTISLGRIVRVSALLDMRKGVKQFNSTREFRCSQFLNCADIQDRNTPLDEQATAVARLMGTAAGYIEDADFVKLREVALTLSLPKSLAASLRSEALSLTFAGRNLKTWTNYSGFDPEVNSNSGANFTTSDFLAQPPVRAFTVRLNANF